MQKKIIIVEDDKLLAQELKELLDNNGYEGMILTDFEKPTKTILSLNADMILLDINLPHINGEFLLKEIRRESTIPIIMVTSKDTEMDEVISMSTGADDYITKPYNPTILLLRIEAILKRVNQEGGKIQYRDIEVDKDKSLIKQKDKQVILSKNEILIFDFLIRNQGKIVARDDIINYLWDSEEFVDDNTLTVNIARLRHKLETIGLKDVIETRRGQGYILI